MQQLQPLQPLSALRRYLFNDAEVKSFDSAQLASECFGGEMTVRSDAGGGSPSRPLALRLSPTPALSFRPKPTTRSRTSSWTSPSRR